MKPFLLRVCASRRYESLEDPFVAVTRRMLVYPVARHWKLTKAVRRDAKLILDTGRRAALRVLLHLHRLLRTAEAKYVFNELYVVDYCVWLQKLRYTMPSFCFLFYFYLRWRGVVWWRNPA